MWRLRTKLPESFGTGPRGRTLTVLVSTGQAGKIAHGRECCWCAMRWSRFAMIHAPGRGRGWGSGLRSTWPGLVPNSTLMPE